MIGCHCLLKRCSGSLSADHSYRQTAQRLLLRRTRQLLPVLHRGQRTFSFTPPLNLYIGGYFETLPYFKETDLISSGQAGSGFGNTSDRLNCIVWLCQFFVPKLDSTCLPL